MKKRILLIQNNISYGGTSSLILFIVKKLSNIYTFDLLCFEDNPSEKEEEFIKYGGSIIKCKRLNYNNPSFFGKIKMYWFRFFGKIKTVFKKAIPNSNYYAIHCFEEFLSAYFLEGAKQLGIQKRIVHFNVDHSTVKSKNLINLFLLKKELKKIKRNATNIVGCSSNSIPKCFEHLLNVRYIYNPIDSKYVFSDFTPTSLTLLQLGTICDNKNQLFSIRILFSLIKRYKINDAKLIIVGQTSFKEINYILAVQRLIDELGVSENVELIGATNSPEYYYKSCSYLILPSKKEAFPLSLLEAQACGVTCFASNAPDIETNIGGVKFIDLNECPEKWANIIFASFKKDKGVKHKHDISRHSESNVIKSYEELYE